MVAVGARRAVAAFWQCDGGLCREPRDESDTTRRVRDRSGRLLIAARRLGRSGSLGQQARGSAAAARALVKDGGLRLTIAREYDLADLPRAIANLAEGRIRERRLSASADADNRLGVDMTKPP
ncbi:hypothetical protein, partial [Frankia canadensis]|uniref:hypothetical protein n=1 Tax=Frankia canadensis TaxID=1836972 RepID=UPI003C2DE10B